MSFDVRQNSSGTSFPATHDQWQAFRRKAAKIARTYEASITYGGSNKHEEVLTVSQAIPSDDGKTVRLTVPELKKDHVGYLRTNPVSIDGDRMWSTETWYTLNEIPNEF